MDTAQNRSTLLQCSKTSHLINSAASEKCLLIMFSIFTIVASIDPRFELGPLNVNYKEFSRRITTKDHSQIMYIIFISSRTKSSINDVIIFRFNIFKTITRAKSTSTSTTSPSSRGPDDQLFFIASIKSWN